MYIRIRIKVIQTNLYLDVMPPATYVTAQVDQIIGMRNQSREHVHIAQTETIFAPLTKNKHLTLMT